MQSKLLKLQLELLPSKRNKFWEYIVKTKIENQIGVLNVTTCDIDLIRKMKEMKNQVKSQDEKNIEGQVAKEYFKSIFGADFIRFSNSPISSALNYGYTIFTGAVIRSVAFSGLNDNIGIWHNSSLNCNNLSCDLVEVFRPIVDFYVYNNLNKLICPLPMEIRKELLNLLNYKIIFDKKKYKVSYAINLFVNEYVNYLKEPLIEKVEMPIFYKNEEGFDG